MAPSEAGRDAQQGGGARRRPLGAPDRRRARGLGRGRHRLRAREGARGRVARPRPARPAVGRRRVLHDRRGRGRPPEDAVADPGDQARRRGRQAPLRAPGRVRLRHRRGRAAGRDLGRRRHQRAALPVAQGDHGREEEAARHEVHRRRRHRGRQGRRAGLAHPGPRRSTRRRRRPPARSSRTRTRTRRSRRSSPGSRKGSCSHERPRIRTSLRGRVQQELARRRVARARSSRRRSAARPPRSWSGGDDLTDDLCASLGKYGVSKVYRVKAPEGLAQPVVDAMAKVIQDDGYKYALFGGGLLGFEIGAGLTARLQRRRDDGGHGGQGPGRQARRRAADPPGLGDRGRRLRGRARHHHRPPERVRHRRGAATAPPRSWTSTSSSRTTRPRP